MLLVNLITLFPFDGVALTEYFYSIPFPSNKGPQSIISTTLSTVSPPRGKAQPKASQGRQRPIENRERNQSNKNKKDPPTACPEPMSQTLNNFASRPSLASGAGSQRLRLWTFHRSRINKSMPPTSAPQSSQDAGLYESTGTRAFTRQTCSIAASASFAAPLAGIGSRCKATE